MTNDPPIAEQWHAALDGRERSELPHSQYELA